MTSKWVFHRLIVDRKPAFLRLAKLFREMQLQANNFWWIVFSSSSSSRVSGNSRMSRLAICLLLAGDVVGPANEFSICFKMSIVSSEKGKKGKIKYVFVTVVCFFFFFQRTICSCAYCVRFASPRNWWPRNLMP